MKHSGEAGQTYFIVPLSVQGLLEGQHGQVSLDLPGESWVGFEAGELSTAITNQNENDLRPRPFK